MFVLQFEGIQRFGCSSSSFDTKGDDVRLEDNLVAFLLDQLLRLIDLSFPGVMFAARYFLHSAS